MTQYQVFSTPRHLRYLFFIDAATPHDEVLGLVKHNTRLWGGRYNPIVPVDGGVIDPRYLAVIQHYDPDIIFYSSTVDLEKVQSRRWFHPSAYEKLDLRALENTVLGVSTTYLLCTVGREYPVILPAELWKTESPLLDYYEVNFGIRPHGYVHDSLLTKDRPQIRIEPSEFTDLPMLLHARQPINLATLSSRQLSTPILRSAHNAHYDDVELVLAKDTSDTADLLYFWNRHLFDCRRVLYITLEQLSLLCNDGFFGRILQDISVKPVIEVVSFSLSESDLQQLVDSELKPLTFNRLFRPKKVDAFPFDVDDNLGASGWESREAPTIQVLNAAESLLFIPRLSFADTIQFFPQQWAVDLQLTEMQADRQQALQFPWTTDTDFIVPHTEGRIRRDRHLTYYVHNDQRTAQAVELRVPRFQPSCSN